MGQISTSVELPAAPDKVFEVAGDPNSFEKWLTLHVKFKSELPAELSTGAKFTEVISMMGMPNTIEWTVDEYEKPKALAISGTGMAGVKVSIRISVEAAGEGSKLDLSTEFEGAMIVGALGKAIEKQGQAELDKSIEQFKALL
ncbi:polyketide cyclase/dehydrase/lipid transport protein [Herbihabitans rhizosphaerae]|uniref:Polyketide cyclase/dehydrase/lipid transport protein n=1 Tax=Herbihabitans rhizosphaerae TaxID=1872711 RepID=A0A4Q7L406_9PSEU|nr:SRPBCC family protein [Herbihabitans rhizosphaerae]RZS43500.1 polyketide cyclase/dehydrase/lipid transport protein [Herbihabitans rhizosphaerae]